jgi:glucose-6-phosphate isomerase
MPHIPLTETPAFAALESHYALAKHWQLRELFANDTKRFSRFSVQAAGLLLDYSKNKINDDTMRLLVALARERKMEQRRDAMFAGEKINTTEHRAVLHTALRAPNHGTLVVDGQNVSQEVHAVLAQMHAFTDRVREGQWLGCTGKPITDIVNIGIGGSDLGPEMATRALRPYLHPRLRMHFVSNADGHDLDAVLHRIQADTALFIVASKSFTTKETMLNAQSARSWFLAQKTEADLPKHFVAVSTNTAAVRDFGIDTANMFPFWDWVGGRYSIWSAIGLPVMLAIGFTHFSEFLAGAYEMDQHFLHAPLEENMPTILALIGLWNRSFFGTASISIAPYLQDLNRLANYLQQMAMESNGKQVATDGAPVGVATCPVIWGNVGTNGQHAYFQMLHQGTDVIPVDFIAVLKPAHHLPGHHALLLANCFAQAEALMRGRTEEEVCAEMRAQHIPEDEIKALLPHRTFPGNRPSNTIVMDALTPVSLGALIALYEHKVFVQGALWGINSFDQWGVELGKVLATQIEKELIGESDVDTHDSSTNALISLARKAWRRS